MWAGADPRSSGPTLDDDDDDPDEYLTALTAASYSKNFQILKRLKPDAERDNVEMLLTNASRRGHADVVQYLLDLGAKPNDKPNGGSTALHDCLDSFRYGTFRLRFYHTDYGRRSKASKYDVSERRATVQLLLERGALWRPDDARQVAEVRRSLYDCEPDVTLEFVERLVKHAACTQDTIHDLLRTPAMKKHLMPEVRKFGLMGFDIRTKEQKTEDERREEAYRKWILRDLMSRYNREKIYEEIWAEPIMHVAKRYSISDVGLGKICKKLKIPKPGLGYWAKKAAGKPIPKRPPLPELLT